MRDYFHGEGLEPIVAHRAPTVKDFTNPGRTWIHEDLDDVYTFTRTQNGAAVWIGSGGGASTFSSVTITGGNLSLNTGNITVSAGTLTLGAITTAGVALISDTGLVSASAGTNGQLLIAKTGDQADWASITSADSSLDITEGANTLDITLMPPTEASSATAAVTISALRGVATFTGFTTAAAASQEFTITNTLVSATSGIMITPANVGTNDAQMTLTRVKPLAGSFVVTLTNNGAAAVDGDVIISFVVLS